MIYKYKDFNENVINLSKKRKFPTYADTDRVKGYSNNNTDFYFIYNLSKNELGKYLNTWFKGAQTTKSNLKSNKLEGRVKQNFLIYDEVWTVKKVDKETSDKLYRQYYNPISLNIYCPGSQNVTNKNVNDLVYSLICCLHSIDDSSYTIWFDNKPLGEIEEIRTTLMKFINSKSIINGHEFMDKCIELGANEDQLHYN